LTAPTLSERQFINDEQPKNGIGASHLPKSKTKRRRL